MKQLTTIYEHNLESESQPIPTQNFKVREAARAVLLDKNGEVYLINVTLHGYHKLPGGGIEEGEEIRHALSRELMEEVGCQAQIVTELGTITEYRNFEKLKQISYCFLACQTGKQSDSALEEGEQIEGMEERKAKSVEAAIALLVEDIPNNLEGKFIQQRDLLFLRTAQSYLSSNVVH